MMSGSVASSSVSVALHAPSNSIEAAADTPAAARTCPAIELYSLIESLVSLGSEAEVEAQRPVAREPDRLEIGAGVAAIGDLEVVLWVDAAILRPQTQVSAGEHHVGTPSSHERRDARRKRPAHR